MGDPTRGLTNRQRAVIDGVRRGLSYDEIARELGVSVSTVKGHVAAILCLLPNPDRLDPYLCIFLWARHQQWLAQHHGPVLEDAS